MTDRYHIPQLRAENSDEAKVIKAVQEIAQRGSTYHVLRYVPKQTEDLYIVLVDDRMVVSLELPRTSGERFPQDVQSWSLAEYQKLIGQGHARKKLDRAVAAVRAEEPRNRHFGTSLNEWIERVPNELSRDAVGLWQLVASGRDGFELEGMMLQEFVRKCIIALIDKGAFPVRPDATSFWRRTDEFGKSPVEISNTIVNEWVNSGREPDHDGIWFAIIRAG
jgi:hypothetical protein